MIHSERGQNRGMNIDFYQLLGWSFILIAAIYALALAGPIARRFYPESPSLLVRLAAPVIFGGLGLACFAGMGRGTFICVALLGLVLISVNRWKRRGLKRVAR